MRGAVTESGKIGSPRHTVTHYMVYFHCDTHTTLYISKAILHTHTFPLVEKTRCIKYQASLFATILRHFDIQTYRHITRFAVTQSPWSLYLCRRGITDVGFYLSYAAHHICPFSRPLISSLHPPHHFYTSSPSS